VGVFDASPPWRHDMASAGTRLPPGKIVVLASPAQCFLKSNRKRRRRGGHFCTEGSAVLMNYSHVIRVPYWWANALIFKDASIRTSHSFDRSNCLTGAGASSIARADSGTIRISEVKGGWFIGASGGSGTLTFHGQQYRLPIGGLSAASCSARRRRICPAG
jgi:hypothetical protein